MSVITFIDLKNICWHIYRKRQTITRVKYAFISVIKRVIDSHKSNKLLFIREGSKKHRWQTFSKSEHKQTNINREKFYLVYIDILNNTIPYLQKKYNNNCEITVLRNKKCEADDIIGMLTLYYLNNEKSKITILSNDKDFYQLVNKQVTVDGLNNDLDFVNTKFEAVKWKKHFNRAIKDKDKNKEYIIFPHKRKKVSILIDPTIYPENLWIEILTYIYNIFLIVPVEPTVRAITKLSG
tara:strand:- start:1250 stop:1963 length:714 start_codon:yes stop_codon:yes gene_type:complete